MLIVEIPERTSESVCLGCLSLAASDFKQTWCGAVQSCGLACGVRTYTPFELSSSAALVLWGEIVVAFSCAYVVVEGWSIGFLAGNWDQRRSA
jgi:hypothetical protein